MKISRILAFGVLLVFFSAATLSAQSSGPDDRKLTDAKSIRSEENAKARAIPIADLYFTDQLGGASWSPNGNEVVFTADISGRPNLWKVTAAGGWPIHLVQSDERQYSATWSPDGKWIAYQQDLGGNELWDIYAVPSDGGEVVNLTNTPDTREEGPRWSPDGKTLAINYKPKDGRVYDLALLDWNTRKVNKLTHEETPNHSWSSVAWSPDGRTIYANRYEVSFTDADVYSVDVASGKVTNLTPHEGNVVNVASALSPDGKTLLITSSQKRGISKRRIAGCGEHEDHMGYRYEMGSECFRFFAQGRFIYVRYQR